MFCQPLKSKSKMVAASVAKRLSESLVVPVHTLIAPAFDLDKIDQREISVWTNDRSCEAMTRGTQKADYTVAICVFERMKPRDSEDELADELLAVVESIGDQLLGDILTLQDETTIEVEGYDHRPLYDRELLELRRIFGAAININLTREEAFQ